MGRPKATDTLGKRKQEFVKWLMKRGVSLSEAKLICYKKFYHEIKKEERKEGYGR